MRIPICAVVGSAEGGSRWSDHLGVVAESIGWHAAKAGFAVLTGGLTGVMHRALEGAMKAGGLTLGILPVLDRSAASPCAQLVLPTPLGIGRNILTAAACDVMVILDGGSGTLEEALFAVDYDRPVIAFTTSLELPSVIRHKVRLCQSVSEIAVELEVLHGRITA
jgi:uncharacterized protein (TIGR00725 family)